MFIGNSTGAPQIVHYASVGAGSLQGCTGGTGTVLPGAPVVQAFFSTTIGPVTLPVTLPTAPIPLTSAANFPNSPGIVWVQVTSGQWQAVYYSGVSGSSLTGCVGGIGAVAADAPVVLGLQTFGQLSGPQQLAPGGTLTVASTAAFPSALPLSGSEGSLGLSTSAGFEVVSYTGIGTAGTSFIGCSPTVGLLPAGGVVVGLFNGYGSGGLQLQVTPAVVPTLTHLRSLPAPAPNTTVRVLGANAPGDGGGGTFVWDSNTPEWSAPPPNNPLADNVGIVLQSFVSPVGAWRREGFIQNTDPNGNPYTTVSTEINAKWFGAVGDGTTDDTAALNDALKAANSIAYSLNNNLHEPPAGPTTLNPTQVTLVLPPGRYNITSTLELNSWCCLRGEGRAVLQTDVPIPILRTAAAWCDIENITFIGGLHSIALFGPSAFYGDFSPTAWGTVPCRIDKCSFIYPIGPAIWHDCSPVTTLTAGATLPAANTLDVASTSGFAAAGSVEVQDDLGNLHAVSYTSLNSTQLLGCSSPDTATLVAGGFVGGANFRTFETGLRVSNFYHVGSYLFWGFGDSVIFINGLIGWDVTTPPVLSGDGLPLGLFNSSDTLLVSSVDVFGAGNSPLPTQRQAVFVGTGTIRMQDFRAGQTDGMPLVRARSLLNAYRGAAAAPVPLAGAGYRPLALVVDGCSLVVVYGTFWLEIYEQLPSQVSLKNVSNAGTPWAPLWVSNGIWLDQGVALPYGEDIKKVVLQYDGPRGLVALPMGRQGTPFTITRGFDPGPGMPMSVSLGVDVTESFVPLLRPTGLDEDLPKEHAYGKNLVAGQSTDNTGGILVVASGQAVGQDTTTGFPLTGYNGGTGWTLALADSQTGFESQGLPAGIYTFSVYLKVNYPAELLCKIGTNNQTASRRVESSDVFQRIEIPFWYPGWYPGDPSTLAINIVAHIPQPITPWVTGTTYTYNTTYGGQQVVVAQVVNGVTVNSVYLCIGGGVSTNPPTGMGQNIDTGAGGIGGAIFNYVGPWAGPLPVPCDGFMPYTNAGLWMINKGARAAPYTFPQNDDANASLGWIPRIYYGTAAPTAGVYQVGDLCYNTKPGAGAALGWVYCPAAGPNPANWYAFGSIAPSPS